MTENPKNLGREEVANTICKVYRMRQRLEVDFPWVEKFAVRLLLLGRISEMAQYLQGSLLSNVIMIPPQTTCSGLWLSAPNSSWWPNGHITQLYLHPCPSYGFLVLARTPLLSVLVSEF